MAVLTIGGYWKGAVKQGVSDKRLLAVMKLFAGIGIDPVAGSYPRWLVYSVFVLAAGERKGSGRSRAPVGE